MVTTPPPLETAPPKPRSLWTRLRQHPLAQLGPGLITGVADDDPSGIGTYSQAGAQFGLGLLWTMPLAYPLMSAIQSICGRIGRVTGRGLAANIKRAFPPGVVQVVVLLLFVANTLNIGADLAAMGEVVQLVTGLDRIVMTLVVAVASLALQVFVPYHRYVFFLKWLTLTLLAYVAVLFTVRVPWGQVALHSVWPQIPLNAKTATVVVGVLGTTISPYLFFWQASEEVEDMNNGHNLAPLVRDAAAAPAELRRIRWDTWSGMFYSNISAWFIMLATGVTLHAAGRTSIDTAAQAAQALRPLAGGGAFILFALGILGVGLIGVPVLAGSAAYAVSETMGWREGLEHTTKDARGFYLVITASVLIGAALEFTPISPMKALFWTAVINGLVAVPLMAVIMILVSKRSVMGEYVATRSLTALGWIGTVVMAVAAAMMFVPA